MINPSSIPLLRAVALTSSGARVFDDDEQAVMDWAAAHHVIEPANEEARASCVRLANEGLLLEIAGAPLQRFEPTRLGEHVLGCYFRSQP